jgi:hypothetical protein
VTVVAYPGFPSNCYSGATTLKRVIEFPVPGKPHFAAAVVVS